MMDLILKWSILRAILIWNRKATDRHVAEHKLIERRAINGYARETA